MYASVNAFIEEYQMESQSTQKLLDALTDESLQQPVAPGHRTLGHVAWHLVHDDAGMLQRTGLRFSAPPADAEPPQSAAAIAQAYRETTASLLEAVAAWSDDKLLEVHDMFGQQWPNGLTLYLFLKHEVHHRGQLTVLMRQAGVPVAGVYGPSKTEWEAMGVPAPTK
ncbi:DinB family protein [Paenibacillus sp. GCM10023250]|uniref:DinB family protein n=1 Tax=Paenibacillus sp. GCM10023250 TaxID=3252648 RepID=UPI0036166E85